ncbi:hypothetical protein ACIQVL_24300 [Streptomyces sp. NPDC090499]|uniref:hypothetical protein n=1 Tax=Streptomyces sp. NPDC090499 TaxID=3365965 RepID=UPI0038077C2E
MLGCLPPVIGRESPVAGRLPQADGSWKSNSAAGCREATPPVSSGWWLVAGGWWLVAGGWWLVAGGWWLVAGGWWLVPAPLRC